jgi:hypothetical protein
MGNIEYSKAQVNQAVVNEIIEWRVYYNQELIARFTQHNQAISFVDYLNNKEHETNNGTISV